MHLFHKISIILIKPPITFTLAITFAINNIESKEIPPFIYNNFAKTFRHESPQKFRSSFTNSNSEQKQADNLETLCRPISNSIPEKASV